MTSQSKCYVKQWRKFRKYGLLQTALWEAELFISDPTTEKFRTRYRNIFSKVFQITKLYTKDKCKQMQEVKYTILIYILILFL
jgi:hypothetical protein